MDQLIVDLTRFSQMRVDPDRFEEVDVGKIVQEVIEDLGDRLAGVNVTVAPDLPGSGRCPPFSGTCSRTSSTTR